MKLVFRFGTVLILIVSLLLTVACGSEKAVQSSQTAETKATETTKAPEVKKEPQTLSFATFQAWKNDGLTESIKAYEQISSNKIDLQVYPDNQFENVLKMKLASGDVPDVFAFHSLAKLLPGDKLEPLEGPWVENVYDMKRIKRQPDGTVVCAPYGGATLMGIIYNKDVFKKAGIDKVPMTYTEFMDAAKKIKATGITPIYVPNKDGWTAQIFALMAYCEVFAEDPTLAEKVTKNQVKMFDVPGFLEVNKKILAFKTDKLINEDYMSATTQMALEALATDKAAMFANMGSTYSDIAKSYPDAVDKLGMFPFKASDKRVHVSLGGSSGGLYVSAEGKKKDVAIEMINIFMTEDVLKVYYDKVPSSPPLRGLTALKSSPWDKQMQEYAATLPVEHTWQNAYTSDMDTGGGELAKMWQDIFAG